LLDRSTLSQVRQLRALVLALLDRARKLGGGNHRHVHLAGDVLEVARDKADLLHAVVGEADAGVHKLQVVNKDQVEAVLAVEPPALGAHLKRGERRRIVQEDIELAQAPHRLDEQRPFAVFELAQAQLVRVDARLR